jgi:hypothetical protein
MRQDNRGLRRDDHAARRPHIDVRNDVAPKQDEHDLYPEVPAPPNATAMTCKDFVKLDEPTRLAVVREILKAQNSAFGPLGDEFSETMANTMCDYAPDRTVREILTGTPP